MPANKIFIVDDDADVRDSLKALLESAGFEVKDFDGARKVLADTALPTAECLIADIRMPDMDGLSLQEELVNRDVRLPVILVTGHGDIPLSVRAMKAGAVDFLEKPFDGDLMIDSVERAIAVGRQVRDQAAQRKNAEKTIATLSTRERQVLEHLVVGRPNKIIAYELEIPPRTVEIHRANLMEKMGARSLSDLVRLALAAGIEGPPKK